jgi:catechol 2,3-dioxygenase-like lactoylglutathione lyase family enzyme
MLGSYPVDVMLLATDLGVARRFYEGTLGLPLSVEDEQFLAFGCGGDSRLVVTKSTAGTREAVTKASWRVDGRRDRLAAGPRRPDPRAPRAGHRRRRGRRRLRFGGLVRRPHDNWIGLLQLKAPPWTAPRRRHRHRSYRRLGGPRIWEGGEVAHGQGRWADHRQP